MRLAGFSHNSNSLDVVWVSFCACMVQFSNLVTFINGFFFFTFLNCFLSAAATHSKFRIMLNLGFLNYWLYGWLIFVLPIGSGVREEVFGELGAVVAGLKLVFICN